MAKKNIYAALAVLSFLYSICVYLVGSGTFSFFIWVLATLFFAFLLFMEFNNRWQKIPKVIRAIFRGFVIAGVAIFVICQGCIFSQFFAKGEANADYLIVLGAQMRDWGPSVVYKQRLDAAVDYLNSNQNTMVIVTGGQGANESITEGDGGKAYLLDQGISEDRIIVENKSVDTRENITNAFELINDVDSKKICIVTNNFHVFRGTLIAERYSNADISGLAAFTEYLYVPNNLVRETFGILKDVI